MNRRQILLLIVIIVAIAVYCWILFFELPDKTVRETLEQYVVWGRM